LNTEQVLKYAKQCRNPAKIIISDVKNHDSFSYSKESIFKMLFEPRSPRVA